MKARTQGCGVVVAISDSASDSGLLVGSDSDSDSGSDAKYDAIINSTIAKPKRPASVAFSVGGGRKFSKVF